MRHANPIARPQRSGAARGFTLVELRDPTSAYGAGSIWLYLYNDGDEVDQNWYLGVGWPSGTWWAWADEVPVPGDWENTCWIFASSSAAWRFSMPFFMRSGSLVPTPIQSRCTRLEKAAGSAMAPLNAVLMSNFSSQIGRAHV